MEATARRREVLSPENSVKTRILFLGNWPMGGKKEGSRYAFFAHWRVAPQVLLMGVFRLGYLSRFEKSFLRFYVFAPLVAFFRSFRYPVVIAYSTQVGLPLAFLLRFFHRRQPALVVFDVESFGRVKGGRRLRLIQYASQRMDRVVYAASGQERYYRKHLPHLLPRLRYIPIGIGPYLRKITQERVATGPIVAPGRHGAAFRDWATLLRGFAPLSDRAELLIIGRKGLPEDERDSVPLPPGLKFLPYLPIKEFQTHIENAPFVILPLPEREQSLGQLTLLFCMAMGKAVIATGVMGVEDYMEEGVTGLLTPPGDAEALSRAIKRLLDHPDQAQAMGRAAHLLVLDKFSDQKMGLAWEKVVRELP